MTIYQNPIISGYNPDPSICRAGEDYYLVNSSFEFFPGVPVYHSRNLVNWEMIGHCLTTEAQLPLEKVRPSGGIYAPTIRFHEGTFFMTTTNITAGGNFIVHSKSAAGPWSEPAWVKQGGIDPSLLFDDDGKVYFTSTGSDGDRQCILICEVDPFTGEQKTESRVLSYGCGGKCPEGPHLYKINGMYYLMLAEGGTEYGHRETMQRADNPYGPFVPCPHNPILSNQDAQNDEISCTGHADLVEDGNGNWWLVCLAVRTCGEGRYHVMLHNLGRETFLAPVVWTQDGWPVVGDHGRIALMMEGPLPGAVEPVCRDFADDFSRETFAPQYNFLRNPVPEHYRRLTQQKRLRLLGSAATLDEQGSPTWVGVRQKDFWTETTVRLYPMWDGTEAAAQDRQPCSCAPVGPRAGLTAYYNNDYHYDLYVTRAEGKSYVCLAKHIHDLCAVTARQEIVLTPEQGIGLRIRTDRMRYYFDYCRPGEEWKMLGSGLAAGLCTEGTWTMTFTGTYLAMFSENMTAEFADFQARVEKK